MFYIPPDPPTHARDVARYLLATQRGYAAERMTNLKLQKLLYYAQGFYLALHDGPLFPERIKAWAHGPVIPEVWHEYKHFGSGPIAIPSGTPALGEKEREVIDSVADVYGQYAAWRLRELTHSEPPWVIAFNGSGVISNEEMTKFFKTRLESPSATT